MRVFDASSVQISYVDEVEAGALVGVESDRQPGRVASQARSSSSPSAADLRLATYRSAISSSFVTVLQLRAVAVTPSPFPAMSAASFDRATPSGCHA